MPRIGYSGLAVFLVRPHVQKYVHGACIYCSNTSVYRLPVLPVAVATSLCDVQSVSSALVLGPTLAVSVYIGCLASILDFKFPRFDTTASNLDTTVPPRDSNVQQICIWRCFLITA